MYLAGGTGLLLLVSAAREARLWLGAARVARQWDEALRRDKGAQLLLPQQEPDLQIQGQHPHGHPDDPKTAGSTRSKTPRIGPARLTRDQSDKASRGVYLLPGWVPTLDVGLASIDEIQALTQIDPRVVAGMDFWLSEDLADFSKLKRVVAEAAAGDGYARWLDTLKGYAAEQVAADVLVTSGARVELAAAPNQAGWDLLVDGEPYNVKVGATASHIAQHFREYPDIGVITSPELAAQFPEHADKIIALPELSNDDLVQLVEGTIDGIDGVGWDFSFPVVTAVFSGLRELNLLLSGDTDLSSSLRNFTLDVASTGGGMWVGGKFGAMLGLPFGPAGVLAGGILGAILGAHGMRALANRIKLANLRRAYEAFRRQQAAVEAELAERWQALQQAVLAQVDQTERELRAHLKHLEAIHRSSAERIKAGHQAAVARFAAAVPGCLEAAADRIAVDTARALAALPTTPRLARLVWPSRQDIERKGLALWSRRAQHRLRTAAEKIRRSAEAHGPLKAYEEATALLQDRLLQVAELQPVVGELNQAHAQALAALAVEQAKLEDASKRAATETARQLAVFIRREAEALHGWLQEQAAVLKPLADQVRAEMRRLGIKPADA